MSEQVIIDREAPPWAQRLQTDLNVLLGRLDRKLLTIEGEVDALETDVAALPVPALTKFYESAELTITAGGSHTLTHALGVRPLLIAKFLVCKTAELGYAAGAIIPIAQPVAFAGSPYGSTAVADAANLWVKFGTAPAIYWIHNFTTGATSDIIPANWRLLVRAWA